jgi:hypothetical protein
MDKDGNEDKPRMGNYPLSYWDTQSCNK